MVQLVGKDKFCSIIYGNGMGFNTAAASLFEAAANAIRWAEIECRHFRTDRTLPDDEILTVTIDNRKYRVRVGRVREWASGERLMN